ncbi:epoxide hydrolase family protein [Pelagibacterium limicola]|uniref:epoxide hydrolase family protein n=1 Tax=Pelagibacterium limicola TaxID=2791022 RepID=UPI0018AFDF8A|nr:epoxide hydrolase family protein [Pelagibacterium limicola]
MTILPFKISVSDDQITDLRERLAMTRWPVAPTADWDRGQALHLVKELAAQWLDGFEWRAVEAELNRFPQYTTEIEGQTIHFLHIKSPEAGAFPLLLVHGWPSTPFEFTDVIGPLSNPAAHRQAGGQAFDLVIPSIPGYGFSGPVTAPGWDGARVARAFDALMKRLGYIEYGYHGGDVGSGIGRELGILAPDGLKGVHVQQIFAFPTGAEGEMEKLTPFEMEGFAILGHFQKYASYNDAHQKRPQTLAFGLVDSPVALLAWNAELHFGFLGEGETTTDRHRYLTMASIYWFTATGGSATNIYFEDAQTGAGYREVMNTVPTGVAVFPNDFRSVRAFAERANNIVHWTEMPQGGHFAAAEAPELLADDIRAFFGKVI